MMKLCVHTAFWTLLCGSPSAAELDIHDYSKLLGQGINLGNTLEAPREGDWGFVLTPGHFQTIATGGFDFVRVPIKFSGHASASRPFAIDPNFLARIDWVVQQARMNQLAVIIDLHHYDEMNKDPEAHRERFLDIWRQIAEHYRDEPKSVFFELLNEPNTALSPALWNSLLFDALKVIRASNQDRPVIVGPAHWNNVKGLAELQLPEDDRHLIGTFHYYSPFEFTHQGTDWVEGSDAWLGRAWEGTAEEQQAVRDEFRAASEWGLAHNRPMLLGEFGAFRRGNVASRARWTEFVRGEAERLGFSWCYWEFGSGFGAYDRMARAWVAPIHAALDPDRKGDFNRDRKLDDGDKLALNQAIAEGNHPPDFDLNQDRMVDADDLRLWSIKAESIPTEVNPEGAVDGAATER